jgi:ribosomal protein S18 acetylase RimI-like enzyme
MTLSTTSSTAEARSAPVRWRQITLPTDPARVGALVAATGVFTEEEVSVAEQLVQSTVDETEIYRFLFAERDGELLGYTCFEAIALSDLSWDLYWIAVHPEAWGSGLAIDLMARTGNVIKRRGGRFVFAETSSTDPYQRTRAFYLKAGFEEAARFADFYRAGDDKVIYRLTL